MKGLAMFLGQDYLIGNETGKRIFASVKDLPILDPHNHADVAAVARNENFRDAWELFAATDHYVWEVLRKTGVPEEKITGNASPHDKFIAMAEVFDRIAGNPVYEWIHLDLRFLGIDDLLNAETGELIWNKVNEVLAKEESRPQALLKRMNVGVMCSTDDPADTLEYHQALQKSQLKGIVHPTFRPDKAMNIFKPDFADYVKTLGKRWNIAIKTIDDLLAALKAAHDFFAENGCVASDHGIAVPYGLQIAKQDAEAVFQKALARKPLTEAETIAYMSYVFNEVAEMDAQKGWVFQIHIGAVRDVRDSLYNSLGADVGGDISDHLTDYVANLLPLLNRFDGRLKTVLYNMNPIHNATLAHLTRAFGNTVSLGLAWWLNDSFIGMKNQLEFVTSVDTFANMGGMVSDSRKILSYGSRHEMFRRTLCHVLGNEVELGQMPSEVAERIAVNLSYTRPKTLFGL